jgi:hypothetical protein
LKFPIGPHYERNLRASSEDSRTRSAIVGRLRDCMGVLLRFVLCKQSRLLASFARSPGTGRSRNAAKARNFDPRTKPFRSSQGHQISQGRSGQPSDEKSENGATKSPSIGELGEVENVGPLPQLENQGSDRRRTGAKRKGSATGVDLRNFMPIG